MEGSPLVRACNEQLVPTQPTTEVVAGWMVSTLSNAIRVMPGLPTTRDARQGEQRTKEVVLILCHVGFQGSVFSTRRGNVPLPMIQVLSPLGGRCRRCPQTSVAVTNWPLHTVLRSALMTVSRYPPAAGSITNGNRACERMFRTESSFTQRMTALSNTEPTDAGRGDEALCAHRRRGRVGVDQLHRTQVDDSLVVPPGGHGSSTHP